MKSLIFILSFFMCLFALDPTKPPGTNFNLTVFKLQTINPSNRAFLEITQPALKTYTSSYFYTDPDGSMVCKCPSNGTPTSGTSYPRVEFRQNVNTWKLADTNEYQLSGTCKVTSAPSAKPQIIIAQVKGGESDTEMMKLQWYNATAGTCYIDAKFQKNSSGREDFAVRMASGLSLGSTIVYVVKMKKGKVTVTVNGVTTSNTYTSTYYGSSDTYYFKAGSYLQYSNSSVVYGIVKIYAMAVTNNSKPTLAIPIFTTNPVTQTKNAGQPVSFSCLASGSPTPTYQWYKSWALISGATSTTYTIPVLLVTDSGSFRAVASNSQGKDTSALAHLTVNAAIPIFTLNPVAQTINVGQSLSFTCFASGIPTPTYQWYKDDVVISGATLTTYSKNIASVTDSGTYNVIATNSQGKDTSASAHLTVNAAIPIFTLDPVTQAIIVGQTLTLTCLASGIPTPTYQWYKNNVSISGAASTTYTKSLIAVTDAGSYHVIATNSQGKDTSASAVITVDAAIPVFTLDPVTQIKTAGQSVTFTCLASGIPTPTYQWYKNNVPISGAVSTSYTKNITTVTDSGDYKAIASNSQGKDTSSIARLTINSIPVFTTNPVAQTKIVGQSVTFTCLASAYPVPTYQWYKNNVAIESATSTSYTIATVAISDSGYYTARATNIIGIDTSSSVRLTVNPSWSNLSQGKTGVTYSSQQTGNEARKANDGDSLVTRWAPPTNAVPQWWKVDLQRICTLSTFKSFWYYASSRSSKFIVATSSDNATYTTKIDKSTNTVKGNSDISFPASVYARYVRITVSYTSSGYVGTYEFKILGK